MIKALKVSAALCTGALLVPVLVSYAAGTEPEGAPLAGSAPRGPPLTPRRTRRS